MAVCLKHHKVLTNGEGKCSVPLFASGMPAGFCDKPAYGHREKCELIRDADGHPICDAVGRTLRKDGKFAGYVPYLACPDHGGPEKKKEPVYKKVDDYPLFELMSREHGLSLLESELDEIRRVVLKEEWARNGSK